MNLDGKTALVTGATGAGGIGFEVAHGLHERGARVVVSGRNPERGAAAVRAIGDKARFVEADLAGLAEVRTLADVAGDVDILVNNAGLTLPQPTLTQDVDSYTRTLDVNVRAPYFLTAALAPAMLSKGSGSIINISSVAARTGVPGLSVYAATKAAMEALTRTWAAEFSEHGVRVNTVMPGPTRTETLVRVFGEDTLAQMEHLTLLKRTAGAAEIAEVVLFLADPRSSFVTGAVIAADGGVTAG